jgi:hypothetical protein
MATFERTGGANTAAPGHELPLGTVLHCSLSFGVILPVSVARRSLQRRQVAVLLLCVLCIENCISISLFNPTNKISTLKPSYFAIC